MRQTRSRTDDPRGRRITLGQLLGETADAPPAAARTPEPRSLPLTRLGLGAACMSLIVLGVGVGAAPLVGGQVSTAAVSTAAPAPIRPLKPNPRPYSRPAWADPSGDALSYLPQGSSPGWFPAPAVEPAPDGPAGFPALLPAPRRH